VKRAVPTEEGRLKQNNCWMKCKEVRVLPVMRIKTTTELSTRWTAH